MYGKGDVPTGIQVVAVDGVDIEVGGILLGQRREVRGSPRGRRMKSIMSLNVVRSTSRWQSRDCSRSRGGRDEMFRHGFRIRFRRHEQDFLGRVVGRWLDERWRERLRGHGLSCHEKVDGPVTDCHKDGRCGSDSCFFVSIDGTRLYVYLSSNREMSLGCVQA